MPRKWQMEHPCKRSIESANEIFHAVSLQRVQIQIRRQSRVFEPSVKIKVQLILQISVLCCSNWYSIGKLVLSYIQEGFMLICGKIMFRMIWYSGTISKHSKQLCFDIAYYAASSLVYHRQNLGPIITMRLMKPVVKQEETVNKIFSQQHKINKLKGSE